MKTEIEMKKAQLKVLEEQLVDKAREIMALSETSSFAVPFSRGQNIYYVVVGSGGAAQGLITTVREREKRNAKK